MGAPALSEPSGDMMAAPPLEGGDDMFSGMEAPAAPLAEPLAEPAASDALPTFEDAAPPPAMGGMDDMGGMPMGGGLDADAFAAPPGGEMGPVAKWRIERDERVAAKNQAAAAAEAAKIAEAQAALEKFYAERQETNVKRAQANREAEKQYVEDRDATMIADTWDSVCKMVDLKEKANPEVDTSRMRSLLIQLKN
jgi:hypothetical protein